MWDVSMEMMQSRCSEQFLKRRSYSGERTTVTHLMRTGLEEWSTRQLHPQKAAEQSNRRAVYKAAEMVRGKISRPESSTHATGSAVWGLRSRGHRCLVPWEPQIRRSRSQRGEGAVPRSDDPRVSQDNREALFQSECPARRWALRRSTGMTNGKRKRNNRLMHYKES